MKKPNIPEGYQRIMPYLIVENAVAFIEFARRVFGAEGKFKAMRDEKLIMHAEINIGGSIIMVADATEHYKEQTVGPFIALPFNDVKYFDFDPVVDGDESFIVFSTEMCSISLNL